jgi:hypothetical protein
VEIRGSADSTNPTTIDGGHIQRCIYVGGGLPPPALVLRNFSLQNGQAEQYGGGLLALSSAIQLFDINVANCTAWGPPEDSDGNGGVAAGGGIAILFSQGPAILDTVAIWDCKAIGGNGKRAGYGQGGGLFVDKSTIQIRELTLERNRAVGGRSSGFGVKNLDTLETADGYGGGFNLEESNATIDGLTCLDNIASGAEASEGYAGGGFGGGGGIELSTYSISNALFRGNTAQGAYGKMNYGYRGGYASGGGIDSTNSSGSLTTVTIQNNTSQAGDGTFYRVNPFGGGLHVHESLGKVVNVVLSSVTFAGNVAKAGHARSPGGESDIPDIPGFAGVKNDTITLTSGFIDL